MTQSGSPAEHIAARYETRWALTMTAIIVFLLAIVVFTGLHWASMPPSRVMQSTIRLK